MERFLVFGCFWVGLVVFLWCFGLISPFFLVGVRECFFFVFCFGVFWGFGGGCFGMFAGGFGVLGVALVRLVRSGGTVPQEMLSQTISPNRQRTAHQNKHGENGRS